MRVTLPRFVRKRRKILVIAFVLVVVFWGVFYWYPKLVRDREILAETRKSKTYSRLKELQLRVPAASGELLNSGDKLSPENLESIIKEWVPFFDAWGEPISLEVQKHMQGGLSVEFRSKGRIKEDPVDDIFVVVPLGIGVSITLEASRWYGVPDSRRQDLRDGRRGKVFRKNSLHNDSGDGLLVE